jgi:hypothetical protein
MRDPSVRYQLSTGDPLHGTTRSYKTATGARRAAKRLQAEGRRVTLWEGTLRPWGGWSWSTVPIDPEERS